VSLMVRISLGSVGSYGSIIAGRTRTNPGRTA
jgi:hypothetical protein